MTGDLDQDTAWTNASVRRLSPDADALATISDLVTELLLAAADEGAISAPTDPFQLASLMGIELRPHFDVSDARLVTEDRSGTQSPAPLERFTPSGTRLVIEYNPTRPRGRLRFNVAHELAHALFPDAATEVRHRTHTGAVEDLVEDDSWQLELLCNVAAAEILMPAAAIEGLVNSDTDIDFIMAQRARFHVSTEALLRRLVHATARPMALASFNRVRDSVDSPLRCEYVLAARAWTGNIQRGARVDADAFTAAPMAVGQTSRGTLSIDETAWNVQAVGTPPYPGRTLPRVLALIEPPNSTADARQGLTHKIGDIAASIDTARETESPGVIAHVVNDRARAWGQYGAAGALRRIVPDAAQAFHSWTITSPDNLTLGNIHAVEVNAVNDAPVTVVSLVAQAGYGPSAKLRLSYVSLTQALDKLADIAQTLGEGATIHMPRIGAGQAGGRWDLIEAAIERSLLDRGIPAIVYTLPSGSSARV